MRVLLIAAVATVADAFSSVVPEEVCRPFRDCSLMPEGWVTQFTVSKSQYESTKTSDEVWAHIRDHEVFAQSVGMKVITDGFLDKNNVGTIRSYTDSLGLGIRQIIYSMVENSHYNFRTFAICGPNAEAFSPLLGFCSAELSMNQTATGWELSLSATLASNNEALLSEQIVPPFKVGSDTLLSLQDEWFSA